MILSKWPFHVYSTSRWPGFQTAFGGYHDILFLLIVQMTFVSRGQYVSLTLPRSPPSPGRHVYSWLNGCSYCGSTKRIQERERFPRKTAKGRRVSKVSKSGVAVEKASGEDEWKSRKGKAVELAGEKGVELALTSTACVQRLLRDNWYCCINSEQSKITKIPLANCSKCRDGVKTSETSHATIWESQRQEAPLHCAQIVDCTEALLSLRLIIPV